MQAYRWPVKYAPAICLLLGVARVALAQTNAPLPDVAPPIRYSRHIQLYDVPIHVKSPAQLQREDEREREARQLTLPDTVPPPNEALPETPPPPTQPNRPHNKRPADDQRWDQDKNHDKAAKDKDGKSGWGWLADDVRKAGERQSEDEAKDAEAEEQNRDQAGPTNRTALADRDWADQRNAAERDGRRSPAEVREMRPRVDATPRSASAAAEYAARAADARDNDAASATPRERPPDWMIASAAAVPDSPIGRSILQSLQAPDARTAREQSADWTSAQGAGSGLGTPFGNSASLFNSAGGLRPLEPVITAPTRLGYSPGESSSLFQPEGGRGALDGAGVGLAQPSALAPAPALTPRPTLGGDANLPGVQTKTLPW